MVILTPILILTGMTANTFFQTIDDYLTSQGVRRDLTRTVELGSLVTELQV
jgi:hypothetical protein